MAVNFDELHAQLDWIREDVFRKRRGERPTGLVWEQEVYFDARTDPETGRVELCGSKACLAGHTALTNGAIPWFEILGSVSDCEVVYGGRRRPIHEVAAEILGLTEDQADELFSANNTVEDLERLVKDWENYE